MVITKPCRKCGAEFEPTPGQAKHYVWICRPCYAAYFRRWTKTGAGKRHVQNIAAQRKADPEKRAKHIIRCAVGAAVRHGKLRRLPCEVCGAQAHAHHDDYSRPLDVRWLCPMHHKQHHHPRNPTEAGAAIAKASA